MAGICFDTNGIELPYTPYILTYAEEMPKPGYDFVSFIADSLVYPKEAQKLKIKGVVHVKFIVNENGVLSDFKIIKGIGGGCDEEAVKAISKMPRWIPGKEDGVTRKVYTTLPIRFGNSDRRL